jgi:hypothetical protein
VWLSTLLLPQNYKNSVNRQKMAKSSITPQSMARKPRNRPLVRSHSQRRRRARPGKGDRGSKSIWLRSARPLWREILVSPKSENTCRKCRKTASWHCYDMAQMLACKCHQVRPGNGVWGSNPYRLDSLDRCGIPLAHPQNETFSRKSAANLPRFYPAVERSAQGRKLPSGAPSMRPIAKKC